MSRLPENSESFVSLAGCLLVATPNLSDALFGRSVCLLVEHTSKGAMGVVLNRPFVSDVEPLWKHLTEGCHATAQPPRQLNFGGPVSGPVVAVHDQVSLDESGNSQGVYLAAQVDNLKKLVYIAPEHYRLFVGHSVWKADQLESEIRSGSWYVMPASVELVFSEESEMWMRSMRCVGNAMLQDMLGLDAMPTSPLLN